MSTEVQPRWPVPPNWEWATLSQLGDVVGGGTPSTKEPSYWGDEINWISPSDLTGYSSKTIRTGRKGITRLGLDHSSVRVMPAGSVHFSTRAPIGHVVISSEPTATNQGFKSLVPAFGILNSYVYYYLIASREYARSRASGTTFLELSGRAFGELAIPVAPTNEQHSVVFKVEELFSELDAGIDYLKKARAQLETYRQAVLKHAFEGKITTQWRTNNTDRGESTSAVLTQIDQEEEAHYHEKLTRWKAAIHQWECEGRKAERPAKPRNTVRATPLSPGGIRALPRLPDRWTWCRVEEIGQVQLGRQRAPKHMSGPNMRPYLRVANVFESRIDISDVYSMNFTPSEFKVYELKRGDILLNEGQSLELVGRPAMFNGEVSGCCFQNTLVRFRPASGLDARYALQLFVHYLKSGRFRRIAKWTNNIAHLGARRFADLEFPFCPLPEQQEIVRVLDETFKAVERIEREIDAALERSRTLRQAILKQAFSGRLVPQDQRDPPVSILLDRIRAEREQIAKRGKLRKTGKRKKVKVTA